jgi:hypothetical protein
MKTKATDLTLDPQTGHYHDPLGKYDFCDDPACPRSNRAADAGDEFAGEQRSGSLWDIVF